MRPTDDLRNRHEVVLVMLSMLETVAASRNAQLWLEDPTAADHPGDKDETPEYSERMAREDVTPVRRAIPLEDTDSRLFSRSYFWAGYQIFGA